MTESDRELLELAAKAVGVELAWGGPDSDMARRKDTWDTWNPLTDDGDALRLAVKLCLEVTPAGNYTAVRRFNTNEWITAEWGYDPYDPMAATRRAIVRAAAAIARATHKEQT